MAVINIYFIVSFHSGDFIVQIFGPAPAGFSFFLQDVFVLYSSAMIAE